MFIIPAELDRVAVDRLGQTSAESTVFLFQSGGCERSAVAELALVAEDVKRPKSTEKIESRVGASLRVSRARECRLVAILSPEANDERATGITQGKRIAEAQQKVAVAEIGACRGKTGGKGERVGAVDVNIGVVHLLAEVVAAQNLVEFNECAGLAIGSGLVERLFGVEKKLRRVGRRNEVELPVFVNSFGRTKPEELVSNDRAAGGK